MRCPSVLHKTKIPTQEISQTQTLTLVLQIGSLALLDRTGHFLTCNPSHKWRFLLGYLRESSRASKFLFLQYTINIDLWFTASCCICTADVGPGPCRYHWCVGLGTKHSLNERKLDDYQSKYPLIEEFAFHGLSQCFSQLFKTILSGQKQTLEGLKNRWNWSLVGELLGVGLEGGICVSVPMAWLGFSATSLLLEHAFPSNYVATVVGILEKSISETKLKYPFRWWKIRVDTYWLNVMALFTPWYPRVLVRICVQIALTVKRRFDLISQFGWSTLTSA